MRERADKRRTLLEYLGRPRLPHGRSAPLLVSMLALLAVGPGLGDRLVGLAVWEVLFTLVMVSGIRALSANRAQAIAAALLAAPATACLWLRQLIPASGLTEAGLGLLAVFLLYATATVALHVFTEETVTLDTLSGALCVYLLMGLAWGALYGLLYLHVPGTYRLDETLTQPHQSGIAIDVPFEILVYFSFTTLTTVGYGDVQPLTGLSRTAAMLEAVLGQFYLAVMVAELVGLHIAHAKGRR